MVFKRRSIPEPPPALAEPEPLTFNVSADHPEPVPAPMPLTELVEILSQTEPVHEPEPAGLEPLAPSPAIPVPGLSVGRMVHLNPNGRLRAGVVSEVHDPYTGDCTVYLFEPVAPCRPERVTYAGDGVPCGPGTWSWPPRV